MVIVIAILIFLSSSLLPWPTNVSWHPWPQVLCEGLLSGQNLRRLAFSDHFPPHLRTHCVLYDCPTTGSCKVCIILLILLLSFYFSFSLSFSYSCSCQVLHVLARGNSDQLGGPEPWVAHRGGCQCRGNVLLTVIGEVTSYYHYRDSVLLTLYVEVTFSFLSK